MVKCQGSGIGIFESGVEIHPARKPLLHSHLCEFSPRHCNIIVSTILI